MLKIVAFGATHFPANVEFIREAYSGPQLLQSLISAVLLPKDQMSVDSS